MDEFANGPLRFELNDSGPPDGPVALLLHGFPADRSAWDHLTPALVGDGRRVLAPDLRGYSPGARPTGRSAYTLPELATDVLALADAAGAEQVDLIGHDWGAALAWHVAAAHPGRVRTLTALSVPPTRAFAASMLRSNQALRSWYMAFFQLPAVPERLMARGGGGALRKTLRGSGLGAEDATRYARRAAEPGAMTGPLNWYRAVPLALRTPAPKVAVPVLFVWGSGDRFISRRAAEGAAAEVTGPYRFVELAGQNHWLPEQAAEQLAELLREHLPAAA